MGPYGGYDVLAKWNTPSFDDATRKALADRLSGVLQFSLTSKTDGPRARGNRSKKFSFRLSLAGLLRSSGALKQPRS